ncbi:MAG: hypothetical protein AAGN82_14635 [Myxococcota bacterium]
MPKHVAEDFHAEELEEQLAELGYPHLGVRRHGALLVIESGEKHDRIPHARLRRDTVHLWILEMPTAQGKWETTPFRDLIDELVELLTTQLSWTLAPR